MICIKLDIFLIKNQINKINGLHFYPLLLFKAPPKKFGYKNLALPLIYCYFVMSRSFTLSYKILSCCLFLALLSGCSQGQGQGNVQYRNTQVPAQQYYQQNPYYYQPQQQYPTQNYQAPQQGYYPPSGGSRYYNNPYAFPPRNQYPYYDTDQQYVPPSYYGSSGDQDGGFEKF